eukprot:jgi/Botrbrau1/9394/Bobra.0252s0019.1
MEFSLLYLEECRATARVKICGFNKKHVPLNIAAIKKRVGLKAAESGKNRKAGDA